MRFHNCRQYTVESVLRFDESGAAAPNPARAAADAAVVLPDEFEAELVLETEIDSDTTAVGDPFTAHLRKSVRRKSQTVIPQGAVVHGRITRLEFVDGYRYLDLGFSYFDVNGARLDIATRKNQLEVGQSHTSTVMINPVHGEASGRAFNTIHRRVPGPIRGAGSRLRLSNGYRLFLKSTAKGGS